MRVAVTGTRGQLAESLKEKAGHFPGVELVALGRPEMDLERPGSAAEAIARTEPDVVVNAAAYTAVDQAEDEPDLAFRINADAAGEVAAAARAAGAAAVHISTDYVFDGGASGAYREDALTNPLGVYGRSKLAGEEQVRAANPDHVIVRTAWVYSPFGRNFVKTIMDAARIRDELKVVADQLGSPTSALDLAEALLTMIAQWQGERRPGTGEIYHLGGSGETSWCGLAEQVMAECERLGLPTAKVHGIGTHEWPTKAERPRNSRLDSGKFANAFGLRLPDWRASVKETVARLAGNR